MDELSFRRLRETLQLLKETDARTRVLFVLVKNLSIEVQQFRAEAQRTNALLLALLNDPQAREDAEALARDLRIQTYKKE